MAKYLISFSERGNHGLELMSRLASGRGSS